MSGVRSLRAPAARRTFRRVLGAVAAGTVSAGQGFGLCHCLLVSHISAFCRPVLDPSTSFLPSPTGSGETSWANPLWLVALEQGCDAQKTV